MAKVYPGVVGGPGITKKSPAPEELQRLSSGGPRDLRPSLSGPRLAAPLPGAVSEGADTVLGRDSLFGEAPAPPERVHR
jgi:hypothetical protein